MVYLAVRNKKYFHNKILPLFVKYNLEGEKNKDFHNFCLGVEILYNNLGKGIKNLSADDTAKLNYLIDHMNKNRYNK
jgi:hypothetical protein